MDKKETICFLSLDLIRRHHDSWPNKKIHSTLNIFRYVNMFYVCSVLNRIYVVYVYWLWSMAKTIAIFRLFHLWKSFPLTEVHSMNAHCLNNFGFYSIDYLLFYCLHIVPNISMISRNKRGVKINEKSTHAQ